MSTDGPASSSGSAVDAFATWERESWESRAAAYAASLGDLTRGSVDDLLDAAEVDRGTRLLDVGTGPGFVALRAADRGAEVRASDQSRAMVEIASSAGVDAVTADAEHLPFDDAAFDAVVAGYVLNHLPRPEAAVHEVFRVLAPGGRLAMTVWDVPAANPAIGDIGAVVTELGLTADVPAGPDAYRFADREQVERLLAGWVTVTVRRLRWEVRVDPGRWFDALAAATPRAGAVLAQAAPAARAAARDRYVDLARERRAADGDAVRMPACAVLISARRPDRPA